MKKCLAAACSILTMLSACSTRGPVPVYSQGGVAPPPVGVVQYPNANPLQNFQVAAQVAQSSPSAVHYDDFMRSGFALIYIRCNEYFDRKGSEQANVNLFRDSIAPLAAVVTGLFALHNYANVANADHDIGLLTLGTTSAVAGLDIYAKNFLFGADNIEAVRTMVNEELNAHAAAALSIQPRNIEEAALQITDNQRICLPSHILASSRVAISKGRFGAVVTGTGGPVESDLLTELGLALNLTPPTITDTQAGLMYAVTAGFARSATDLKFVRGKLAGLPEAVNPIADDGSGNLSIKGDFPFAKLKQIFDAAPAATRLYLGNQSKLVMSGASSKALADAAAIRNAGGTTAMLAARLDPDQNLRDFAASAESDYSLPSGGSPKTFRRVRVNAQ
jgi:hypothetical protein